jgi:succinyl-CoA synthetase alpha subunit
MSVLVDKNTRLLVQGFTGKKARSTRSRPSPTAPTCRRRHAGQGRIDASGPAVFNTVAKAVKETGANATVIFVPPPFAADAIMEAADAGIALIVCITEGIPVIDMVKAWKFLQGEKFAADRSQLPRRHLAGQMQDRHHARPHSSRRQRRRGFALRHADL